MKYSFILLFILGFYSGMYGQSEGCTDPNAINYDPNATINDGSCAYDPTFFNPPLAFGLPDQLDETSGLIMFDGSLWSHNDSGGEASIYRIDTLTGNVVQEISIAGASHVDWEDISQDEQYIYIGDFGNNNGNRDDLVIYRINKADIPAAGDEHVDSEKIAFKYSDQRYAAKSRRENNFDCEAMVVTDSIYLFSKNWENNKTKLYAFPKVPGTYTAELRDTYDVQGLVTGADLNPEAGEIILSGYENFVPFIYLLWDYNGQDFFGGNKRRIDFPQIFTAQTEGICYYQDKKVFISAEETQTLPQRVYRLNSGRWTDQTASAIEAVFSREVVFSVEPNPVKGRSFKIRISEVPEDEFRIQLYDSTGRTVYMGQYSIKPSGDVITVKFIAAGFGEGLYVLRITSGNHFASRKIIIQ